MDTQPTLKLAELKPIRFIETCDKGVCLHRICRKPDSINGQKSVSGGERRVLIAVNERMILGQTFPKRCSFLNKICVITGLWTIEGCL